MHFLILLASIVSLSAADWPQWRRPNRDGHAPASGKVITKLPAGPKIVWKIKAGPGLASPIVAGDKVSHFDAVGKTEALRALKRATGEQLWSAPIDETFH